MSNIFYEMLGRATWAIGKRKVKQRLSTTPSIARYVAAGVIAVGVVGIGALVARTGSSE